jgi:2-succinyl-6-hydroxy-2,4-cyclohexadiene-1-carboxylate synthase
MTRIDVGGVELAVVVVGTGPALLLLHGFTGSAATWAPLVEAQRDQRRVIVPDLLGHGRSAAPTVPTRYALEHQADDLAALLAILEAVPADVLGYSMGARLALLLALRHPAAVRSLLLESPSAGLADTQARAQRQAADERLAQRLEHDGLAAFVDDWQAQPLFASHAALPAVVQARLRAERLSHDPRGLAASLRGAGQAAMAPLHDRLAAVACPTFVIAGAMDDVGLERAKSVASGIQAARLAIVEDAGHTPHLEQPDTFLRLVDERLAMITQSLH